MATKKRFQNLDLHDRRTQRRLLIGSLIALGLLSLLIRISLIDFQNPDYQTFAGWYDYVKLHGFSSFKDTYSNYNPPYTYFLYLVTLLPISKIHAVKGLMFLFDIALAAAVYRLVRVFRPAGYSPLAAAVATMYLPTVLFTGVLWGQFDQLYVAAMVMSLVYGLKNNSRWAWIWFGAAIAVKFQAIFLLPVLGVLLFKRIKLTDAYWAVITFVVLTIPPLFTGRSLGSLINIYPEQTRIFNGNLTLNAPNLYQWVPSSAFPYFNHMGIGLAAAVCAGIVLAAVWRNDFSRYKMLVCATLILYAVPFFLPAMHERYFFAAGIANFVLAILYPSKTSVVSAVGIQVITVFTYTPFLFNASSPVPLNILAVFVLAIIVALGAQFMVPGLAAEPKSKAGLKQA